MNIKFDHINITVSHLENSVNWYKKVFGFKLVQNGIYGTKVKVRWAIVAHKDTMMCIHELKGRRNAGENNQKSFYQINHFGIRISDLKVWEKKIKIFKLKPVIEKYPYSTSYYITDPDGHMIEVSWTKSSTLNFSPFKSSCLKRESMTLI